MLLGLGCKACTTSCACSGERGQVQRDVVGVLRGCGARVSDGLDLPVREVGVGFLAAAQETICSTLSLVVFGTTQTPPAPSTAITLGSG